MAREARGPGLARALAIALALTALLPAGLARAMQLTPIATVGLRHLAEAAELPSDLATGWLLAAEQGVTAAVCAPEAGTGARFALVTGSASAAADHRCVAGGLPAPVAFTIGREAVFLVARRSGDGFRLASRDLYLALAAEVPWPDGRRVPNPASRWRDLDPRLPDSPIRVRVPAPDTPLGELFAQTVLEAGCLSFAANRAIFDAAARVAACTTLRADAAVVADPVEASAWLAEQPPHAVAVVAQPDVARMDDTATVLALDGVVPTYAAVTSDAYPAARTVQLVLVPASDDRADAARTWMEAASALVRESSIGPSGTLAKAGLTPLPAAERVELRARLRALGGS